MPWRILRQFVLVQTTSCHITFDTLICYLCVPYKLNLNCRLTLKSPIYGCENSETHPFIAIPSKIPALKLVSKYHVILLCKYEPTNFYLQFQFIF